MSFLDDVNVLIGGGMNAMDRKTQSFRLRAEINQIASAKEQALANLGRTVYAREGVDSVYIEHIRSIADLDAKLAALQQQYASLQNNGVGAVAGPACPACGSPVMLDAPFCPRCGDSLALLKAQYRKCPTCGTFYMADSLFCERCGTRTVELEVITRSSSMHGQGSNDAPDERTSQMAVASETKTLTCPSCGAPLKQGALFCGACGGRVQECN